VGVKKSCSFLADAINLSQQGIERAKTEVDQKVDKLRQVIHEKTAPRSAAGKAPGPEPAAPASANSNAKAKTPRNSSRPRRKTTRAKGRK
jgi:hypothetical protein